LNSNLLFTIALTHRMRKIKTFAILALCLTLLIGTASCVALVKKDNGKHKGWSKNQNNPNGENSGKTKDRHKR
jgi:hypothetical protein